MKYDKIPKRGWCNISSNWDESPAFKDFICTRFKQLMDRDFSRSTWDEPNKGAGYAWNFENGAFNMWSVSSYSNNSQVSYNEIFNEYNRTKKIDITFDVIRYPKNKYLIITSTRSKAVFRNPIYNSVVICSDGNLFMYQKNYGMPRFIHLESYDVDSEGNYIVHKFKLARSCKWNADTYKVETGAEPSINDPELAPDIPISELPGDIMADMTEQRKKLKSMVSEHKDYSSYIGTLDTLKSKILHNNMVGDKAKFVAMMQILRDNKSDHLIPVYLLNFYRQYVKGAFPKFDEKWEAPDTKLEGGLMDVVSHHTHKQQNMHLKLQDMLMGSDSYNPHPYSSDHPSQAPIQDLLGSDDDIDARQYVCEGVPKRVFEHHGSVYDRKLVDTTKSAKKPILFQVKTRIIN